MDTKALRRKILDLAIRGQLVPQDPADEPASVLLDRIRAEKQKMVKEGKLKAKDIKNDSIIFVGEDSLHYEKFADGSVKCIEDEIPFELPEGWAWARLGTVFSTVTGATPSTKDASLYGTDCPFYKPTDLDAGYNVCGAEDSVSEKGYLSGRPLPKFSVLVTCIGATIGKTGYISNAGICNQQINAVLPNSEVLSDYTYFCMCSQYEQEQIWTNSSATTLPILNKSKFDNLLFPIPPHEQQSRIVERIKGLFFFVEKVQSNQESLKTTVGIAKSKILDLAIRGQLVPQDPNDEPASVLLERIRAEKEELIRQGKLKRDKKESVIFRGDDNSYYEKVGCDVRCIDEEIPFEVPDTWAWTRLENCCIKEIRRGKAPRYVDKSGVLVFAQKCNTKHNGIDIGLSLSLDETTLGRYSNDEYMQDGDVVINSTGTGTLGRVGLYRATDNVLGLPIVPDSHVTIIRAAGSIQALYLYTFLKVHQGELEKKGEGSTNQKELKPLTLKKMLIALPPISEQRRIEEAINISFSHISAIEKSLS